MGSLRDEPPLALPKDLQEERFALRQQRDKLSARIKALDELIKERRRTCEHERPKNLSGYEYAVYCTKCGHMIDSWL